MRVSFTVEGRPVPQGSMVASYNRKQGVAHVHHQQGEALAQWRAAIRIAAREAGAVPTAQPLAVSIEFGMPRPKAQLQLRGGRYVVRWQYRAARPAVAPDLDKLVRAVLDALTGVCYADDSQVVTIRARKVYGEKTTVSCTWQENASGLGDQKTLGLG